MKIAIVVIIALLLAGCSTTKKSAPPRHYPVQTSDVAVVTKGEHENSEPLFVTPKAEQRPAEVTAPPSHGESAPVAPLSSNFTEREMEHIKVADYNPFESSPGSFVIELSEMERNFTFPLSSCRFSSGYGARSGSFHSGVDLVTNAGDAIYAIMDGVVRMARPYAAYGNVVVIRHANGLESVYSHNAKNLVRVGEQVRSGQKIGTVGRTGRASTNHLHFEVRIQGQAINPLLIIDPARLTLARGRLHVKKSVNGKITASNSQQAPAASPAAAPTSQPAAKTNYHTVRKGDTLSSIARRYGTSVAEICRLNSISQKSILSIGKKLVVK